MIRSSLKGRSERSLAGEEEEAKLNIGREDEEERLLGGDLVLHRQYWFPCLQHLLLDS